MKLTIDERNEIIRLFNALNTRTDLLYLLNYIKKLIYKEKSVPFEPKQLTYYIQKDVAAIRYRSFTIKKKRNGERFIDAPKKGLKQLQKCIAILLQTIYIPTNSTFGFINKKSIVDNAKRHLNSHYLLNIDLKDFFNSIEQKRVWACLKNPPFKLNEENNKLDFANMIAAICCKKYINDKSEIKYILPQGAPTSPVLSNIVCQKLDYLLNGLANRYGLHYSRYADDITFSSLHNVFKKEDFNKELLRIIISQGFQLQESKRRYQKSSFRMEVTGLVINEDVNVKKIYIKTLRSWIYYWERYGYLKASKFILDQYTKEKGHVKNSQVNIILLIRGRLSFLKMVRGDKDELTNKLLSRFNNLYKQLLNPSFLHEPITLVQCLSKFSNNSYTLKYTNHSWDYGDFDNNYDNFMKKIETEWVSLDNTLKRLSFKLHSKISNFLFNKHLGEKKPNSKEAFYWGEYNIKIGWSSLEIKQYCLENKTSPFYYPLPIDKRSLIQNKETVYFYDIIDQFKNEIEFRNENDALYNYFIYLWKEILGYDYEVILKDIKGISFYTDTQWIKIGLKIIFEQIRKRGIHFNKVSVSSLRAIDTSYIDIIICHINSDCTRDINDPKIIGSESGDFSGLEKIFKNLCDWSIKARFPDKKYYQINYLTSLEKKNRIEETREVEGFTHTLRFYYDKNNIS